MLYVCHSKILHKHCLQFLLGVKTLQLTHRFLQIKGSSLKKFAFLSENSRQSALGRPTSYEVDTSGAGLGELAIQCRGPGGNVPVDVRPTAPGKYNVTFIPNKPGEYSTHFVFNGEDIPGSPVKCLVNDPTRIVAHGDGLHQVTHHVISQWPT